LLFLSYLHLRAARGTQYPRLSALLVTAGGAAIVVTLLWVNLAAKVFPGMHSYS